MAERRGFGAMPKGKRQEIASKGGRASGGGRSSGRSSGGSSGGRSSGGGSRSGGRGGMSAKPSER
jgi:hypothetical protein